MDCCHRSNMFMGCLVENQFDFIISKVIESSILKTCVENIKCLFTKVIKMSGPGRNGNERLPHTPQMSKTETSQSDAV